MSSSQALVLIALSSLCVGGALAEPPPKKPNTEESPSGPATCSQVTASARNQGYGFAHVVTLKNDCKRAVTCDVWTDVDPEPRHKLRAGPGETQEVRTRVGSPASAVNAQYLCRYE